jgi:hypothetical protein
MSMDSEQSRSVPYDTDNVSIIPQITHRMVMAKDTFGDE